MNKLLILFIFLVLPFTKSMGQSGKVTKIYTDFGGYWYSGGSFAQLPNNSHNVLAFVYDGVTYSTGVNDALLNSKGVTFTTSSFYGLPAILTGAPGNAISVGSMIDESFYSLIHTHPKIKDMTSENVLTDGIHGLNIGTGYTNLPAATTAVFNIQTVTTSKINDAEPDILVAEIAGVVANADVFKFVDASGNLVGNTVSVSFNDAAKAPLLSNYSVDQFVSNIPSTATASTAKPSATSWSSTNANGTGNGQIRLVAFKLSEFGITAANYTQIKSFVTIPSGFTDLAFVAYSNGSINVPPSLGINTTNTNSVICSDINNTSNAFLSVRPYSATGGSLSYYWEVSTDGGSNWATISNNATYSGATTTDLNITGATVGYQYRATVTESGTGYSSTSATFTISSSAGTVLGGTLNPTNFTSCAYANTGTTSLSVAPAGGTGSYSYKWSYSSTSTGTYTDIPGQISSSFSPDLSVPGTYFYKATVTSGCYTNVSTATQVIVNGGYISAVTNGQKCTTSGAVELSATATSGTVNWFAASSGGTALATGNTYSPSPTATTTYYVAAVSGSCASARVAVVASVFTTSLALTMTATNTCQGSPTTVSVYNSSIADGTYTLNYTFSGSNASSNGSASVAFVNGAGSFNTNNLNTTATTTLTISGVVTSSNCTVTSFTGNTYSVSVTNSNPNVSNLSLTATSACTNNNGIATISSSSLSSGTYLITYNISGTNTVASTTAQMVFTAGSPGTGTFTLPLLTVTGTNNVLTATNIALLSSANCGSAISSTYTFANNTTPIVNAGVSFSACATAGSAIEISGSSTASDYSALSWSSSNGTGTFGNNTTGLALNSATFSPTAADITRGSAYLTLTATANPGCADVIKTITLTLTADAVGGSVSSNQSITYNTQPSTLTLSGYTGSITRWEKSTDPGFTSPTNLAFTTTTLTGANIGNITATTYFRAVITRGTCVQNSNYATVSISGSPTITSFTPAIASTGETITITGTNFTGATAVSIGGTAAGSFTVLSSTSITAVVAAGSSGSISVANSIGTGSLGGFVFCTVTTPTISINADATSICNGTSVRFTASISNGGSAPTYQWKKNGSNVGISSPLYTDAALANGDIISCVLTSNENCVTSSTANSNNINITVSSNSAASLSISSSSTSICSGTSLSFTATVTNPGTSLAYQWKKNNTNVGTNSSSYTDANLANGDMISCVLTSSSACVPSASTNSNTLTITVNAAPSSAVLSGTTTITPGNSTNLQVAITGGSAPYTVVYSNGSSQFTVSSYVSASNIVVSPSITTTYTLVSATGSNGCSSLNTTGSAIVTVSDGSSSAVINGSTSICSGGTANVQVIITGGSAPYTVVYSNGSSNTTINSYTSGTNIAVSPTTSTTYTLVSVTDAAGSSISNLTGSAVVSMAYSWVGNSSNLWNNPSNWCSGVVPGGSETIIISSGNPVVNTDLNITGSLTLSGSGTLTINPGKTLSIAAGGVADFGGKLVTFKSDATGTGQLGTVAGTLSNATNVLVERHIPAGKRAFRFFSSPVTTTTTIRQNWMEGATPGVLSGYPYRTVSAYNPILGYGTLITGAGGNANGFDESQTNNPSLFTFNNSTGAWVTSTNTSATIAAGSAYRLFVRGDRSYGITASSEPPAGSTILRTTGTIAQGQLTSGTQLPALSQAASGWSLVGNPYQSVVDMSSADVVKTNLTPYYYVWDPRLSTRGAYVAYNYSLNTSNNGSSAVNRYAQPGQAFFVQNTTAGSNSLVFKEAAKGAASNQTATFARNNTRAGAENGYVIDATNEKAEAGQTLAVNYASLSTILYYTDSLATGAPAMDATRVLFGSQFSNIVDGNDGRKFTNLDETMAIKQGTNLLSMELRGLPDTTTIIPLNITQYVDKKYTMRLLWDEKLTTDTLVAYLRDKYTNKETEVKKTGNTDVEYILDADAKSSAADRFEIIFKRTSNQVTAVINYDNGQYIKIYPNPVRTILNIDFDLGQNRLVDMKVYDMAGRLVMDRPGMRKGSTLTMSSLAKGTYNVKVWGSNGKLLMSNKIIKD